MLDKKYRNIKGTGKSRLRVRLKIQCFYSIKLTYRKKVSKFIADLDRFCSYSILKKAIAFIHTNGCFGGEIHGIWVCSGVNS